MYENRYLWEYWSFLLWLVFVSVAIVWAYITLGGVALNAALHLEGLSAASGALKDSPLDDILIWVTGVLLWWRAVKVLVLLGAPIKIGIKCDLVPSKNSRDGIVTLTYIGNRHSHLLADQGMFWYGAAFRAHSNSDKIVRSRLLFLVLWIPGGFTLLVNASRVSITHETHFERAQLFVRYQEMHGVGIGSTGVTQ